MKQLFILLFVELCVSSIDYHTNGSTVNLAIKTCLSLGMFFSIKHVFPKFETIGDQIMTEIETLSETLQNHNGNLDRLSSFFRVSVTSCL